MPKHVVKQGEDLASIAARYGFGDWRTVYDAPQNADLRKKRPDPHQLFPGDEVFVPERKPKTVTVKTGETAKLEATVPLRELRLRLLDANRRPLADEPYTIQGEGEFRFGRTDGDGLLTEALPGHVRVLSLFVDGRMRRIRLGDLDPTDNASDGGISGVQARLANLGYHPGPVDGILGPWTRAALLAFEADHGLDPTGAASAATVKKLVEVHGS